MKRETPAEAAIGMVLSLLVVFLILGAGYCAPCGCYAGTASKDVPMRCWEERGQPR